LEHLMKRLRTLAVIAAAPVLALLPSAAHATTLNVDYDTTGTSHIASTGSDLWIKPTTLSTTLDSTSSVFTGHLPLLPADTKFHVLGFLPVKATVNFIEAAPVTGHAAADGINLSITATASYYIRLSDVLIGGLPGFVGDHCQTKDPVTVTVGTPAGQGFSLLGGGELAGTYSIGDFENCNLQTGLINLLVPGNGNTIDLQASNGHFVS
jgi:hypothetical protein